jgi:Zn-dependent M28 family amino/carboxypeptidase
MTYNPVHFVGARADTKRRAFGTSSDYLGFLRLGIPSSGIFTGAGAPEDPCYHQACDDLDNIHWEALTVNTKAAASAAAEFALSLDGVPLRNISAAITTPRRRAVGVQTWESVMMKAETVLTCSHVHEHPNLY